MSKDLIERLRAMAGLEETWWFDPEAINEAITALEAMQWRDVREELPLPEKNFFSFSPAFGYQVSMYSDNALNSTGLPTLGGVQITHWLPLPPPPESE